MVCQKYGDVKMNVLNRTSLLHILHDVKSFFEKKIEIDDLSLLVMRNTPAEKGTLLI
jgi:hypothetical protein